MSITFDVDDVVPAGVPLPLTTFGTVLERTLLTDRYARRVGPSTLRAYAGPKSLLEASPFGNPLANAVHLAFARHYPLTLTPDVIWTTIAQGFAFHIRLNAEALRGRFVEHQGKLELVAVCRSEPTTGSDWESLVEEWCTQIRTHVGDGNADFFLNSFSTSGPVERTVSGIVMMDAFERYFDYMAFCVCGIPQVELVGEVEDWREIRRRIELMGDCGVDNWLSQLRAICDQFVESASGRPDRDFWQCMYKPQEVYGGYVANGWLTRLFPYLESASGIEANHAITEGPSDEDFASSAKPGSRRRWLSASVSPSSIPNGLSRVPVAVSRLGGTQQPFELIGGLMGVVQNPQTLALQPVLGWAVRTQPRDERVTMTPEERQRGFADLMAFLESKRTEQA